MGKMWLAVQASWPMGAGMRFAGTDYWKGMGFRRWNEGKNCW